MKKTVQVIMLPTTDIANNIGVFGDSYVNLYFISNEEIKEGDWVYIESYNNTIIQNIHGSIGSVIGGGKYLRDYCKKVIATTDKSLNLPLIPQSFVEEYVKNNEIKEVDITFDSCNNVLVFKNTKKQTLEEAAHSYIKDLPHLLTNVDEMNAIDIFIAGAKWQQSNS